MYIFGIDVFTSKLTDNNFARVYLFLLIILALLLRLYKLDFQSLWGDELYSLLPTHPDNTLASVIEYSKSDQPPLYFILLHYWFKLLPHNEYTGRLLSAVFGVMGVIAMYFLGKEFKDKQVGLLASTIATFNYFQIYYSQEMRFYSLLFLMTTLSYLYFLRCIKHATLGNYIWYCLFSTGLVYTHYFGPVVIISQAIIFFILLTKGFTNNKFIIYSVLSGIVMLLAYLPWMPVILKDTEITSFWIAKPSPVFFGLYYYLYLGKDPYLAVLFFFLIALFIRQFIKRDDASINQEEPAFVQLRFTILWVWIITSYVIPYIYSVVKVPILEARYTLIALPALFIIFSIGLSSINNNKMKWALVGSIMLSTAINFIFFRQYYTSYTKDQIRDAAYVTIANYEKPTKVYSSVAYFYNYYFQKSGSGIVSVNPTTWYPGQADVEADFETELAGQQQVWILGIDVLMPVNEKQQAYLDANFTPLKTFDFVGTVAILYSRK